MREKSDRCWSKRGMSKCSRPTDRSGRVDKWNAKNQYDLRWNPEALGEKVYYNSQKTTDGRSNLRICSAVAMNEDGWE
jgi:hypothetical protein